MTVETRTAMQLREALVAISVLMILDAASRKIVFQELRALMRVSIVAYSNECGNHEEHIDAHVNDALELINIFENSLPTLKRFFKTFMSCYQNTQKRYAN